MKQLASWEVGSIQRSNEWDRPKSPIPHLTLLTGYRREPMPAQLTAGARAKPSPGTDRHRGGREALSAGPLNSPRPDPVDQAASRFDLAFAPASPKAMIISPSSKLQKPPPGRFSPRCSYGQRPRRRPPPNARVFQYSRFRSSSP
jgi:hypothetical protein